MHKSRSNLSTVAIAFFAIVMGAAFSLAMSGCAKVKVKPERTTVVKTFTPKWYDQSARAEDGTIAETAQANMATRELAEAAATNQARANMGLTIQTRVDVLQRTFQEQVNAVNDPEVLGRFQNINNIVASTTLRGSYVDRKETYIEPDGSYRCFVLMKLSGADIDKNYLNQMRQIELLETRLRSSEAWKELERRVDQLNLQEGSIPPMTDRELSGEN
ncbi:MAG: hypothetical protein ACYTF7_05075 [Planctomycetota bacterium]|jgi:hypothetical protein